jgi:hypothetical protein
MTAIKQQENKLFNLATEVINFTSCNLFLTGKAGTGKTTFLKQIKDQSQKNIAIVAPTGVAAINAGGVTMHSFFQLPFNLYLPAATNIIGNNATVDKHQLLKNLRFNKEKTALLNELELLIIDEVSMVRADLLQAVNDILQYVRQNNKPFGGVQLLLIGDLFQLPPVVSDDELELMRKEYESPFFFSAPVIRENPPLFIELKEVYRQKEASFINLLNNIRNNTLSTTDLDILRSRHTSNLIVETPKGITLTTHNRMADEINQRELAKLPGKTTKFSGAINGDFSEKALPTEMELQLKTGTQIMFIKNDSGIEKRYYNGKLATVKYVSAETVRVEFNDTQEIFEIEKEKWTNIMYTLNKETNKLEEEELGSFTQYPIRLAWAITIHKSQGLTFDDVVIDAGSSFAAGQVYVALSRCRTLNGITLLSHITPSSVQSDSRILKFAQQENSTSFIEQKLQEEKPKFAALLLLKTFDWSKLMVGIHYYYEQINSKKLPDQEMIKSVASVLLDRAKEQQQTADKFVKKLEVILQTQPINAELLNERVTKAKQYFAKVIHDELIMPIEKIKLFLNGKVNVKQFSRDTDDLDVMFWKKLNDVQRITFGDFTFDVQIIERKVNASKASSNKAEKGSTKLITLEFYQKGLSVIEIAKQRGITTGTVENHLADFISNGQVNVFDFLSQRDIDEIQKAIIELDTTDLKPIKVKMGEALSYSQVKMGLSYLAKVKSVDAL